MALIGGDKKKTKSVTNVSTETSTRIRDIGLTGNVARGIVQDIEAGSIRREELALDTIESVGDVVESSFSIGSQVTREGIQSGERASTAGISSAERLARSGISSAEQLTDSGIYVAESGIASAERTSTNAIDKTFEFIKGVFNPLTSSVQSAQASAFELQRQAVGTPGPDLVGADKARTYGAVALGLGALAVGLFTMRVFKK